MKAEDVSTELVEKAARILHDTCASPPYGRGGSLHDGAIAVLAAVIPEIQAQALESLRDEFKAWHVYDTRDLGDAFSSDVVIEEVEDRIAELRAARLTDTTTEGEAR